MPHRRLFLLSLLLASGACDVLPVAELRPCAAAESQVSVNGETNGIDGTVTVVVSERDGVITLSITPDDAALVHTATFDLAGADLDELQGDVVAAAGAVFAGEGSEYGYLRLTDARGLWFEGGRSPSIDGVAHGGAAIDAPFLLGDETGDGCRLGGASGYNVALHDVLATLNDASEPVLLDASGTDGTWRGADVRAVGVRASRGVYEESPDTADGLGAGQHELVEVVGYLYRRSP